VAPLADEEIVDRPLRDVRALTDGSRKYRLAAWSPAGLFIAAVPQDGPGMDVLNAETGEVATVVTDTYVLEPRWSERGQLLIHRTSGGQDTIALYDPARGNERQALAAGAPISALDIAAGMVAFSREGQLWICDLHCQAPAMVATVAALAADLTGSGSGMWLAWNPMVSDLEAVQTLIRPIAADGATASPDGATALSMPGEGWWLPIWSPDAGQLAMTSIEGRIAIFAADGSARLDLGPGDSPVWSPDGSYIAYAGASAGLEFTRRDIHLIRADGRGRRMRLTDAGEGQLFASPSWSPDGRQLTFVEIDSGQVYVGSAPAD
jgi:Tol biopolymer transport system component